MNEQTVEAFFDEMEKIGAVPATVPPAVPSSIKGLMKMRYLKYPLMIGGGIAGWEQLKNMKRRYDIGRMVEEQQRGR